MKKLDKFILKAFIGPFFAILIVVILILMMQFLWLYIDELVGKGLSFKVVSEFLFWGSCTILPMALPLTTLLASMMTMGQMGENNELIAVKSAGVSLFRVILPLIIVSFFIGVATFFSTNDLVPLSFNKIYTLRDDIGKTKDEIKIPTGIFYDGLEGYVMRVSENDDATGEMRGIMVYDHTGNEGNTNLTLAETGQMRMSKDKKYLTFTLFNGANYKESNSRSARDTSMELQRIDFSKQELIIRLDNYAFEQSDEMRFGDQVKSMKIMDLKASRDSLEKNRLLILDHQTSMFLRTERLLKSQQLDTVFNSEGMNPLKVENFMEWPDEKAEAGAYYTAMTMANDMVDDLSGYGMEVYPYLHDLRRTELELLRKFGVAIACFILFFIGAPLGALIRKGGLGSSAITSVLFFVLYYIIDIIGSKLAKDGAVSPAFGAFISPAVMLPIGALLTWLAIRDASLFANDNIKSRWNKIKSKFNGIFRKTRIVFMGTPEFAVASLDALVQKKYNIVGVVTVADKPSGRGLQVNESAVKKYAVEHNIPVLQPLKLKDPEFLAALQEWKADLFVVVAFRMLPEEVWQMPKLGTFNLHAALLPQYRGAAPINWAVINGERMTGVTTFMIDKNIDTGGIILRQEHRISETDTAGDVHDALMEIGAKLVVETVDGIIEKNVETRVQRSFIQGSEVLKPAPKITRETCHIDWNRSTKDIYNLIRGLSPYPAAFTTLLPRENAGDTPAESVSMKIYFGEPVYKDTEGRKPGTIVSDGRTFMEIITSDGAISIKDLQIAGKKRMDVKAFLLGFRDPQSYSAN